MIYALVENGAVVSYPYSFGMLRADNPDVSFSNNPSDDKLAEYGVVLVDDTPQPANTETQTAIEDAPAFVNERWVRVWKMVDASAGEIASRAEQVAQDAEFDAAKLDAWVIQFLAMTPAEAQNFVNNNSATLAALRTNVARLAYVVRVLVRRELS